MRFLLDSNVLIDVLRQKGHVQTKAWFDRHDFSTFYLPSIALGELWHGIECMDDKLPSKKIHTRQLEVLEQRFADRILSFDTKAARMWGKLKGRHEQSGRSYPNNDLQIAVLALVHRLPLVTANGRDFEGLGIKLINPRDET